MHKLLARLQKDFPSITFVEGDTFYWSPKDHTIHYATERDRITDTWKLLHETAHAVLGHSAYTSDFELVALESAAWQKATELGVAYGITIDPDHIEDSLDSYRDWLHARSTCPTCLANGVMTEKYLYGCLNCAGTWQVSSSRFCRTYRRKTAIAA